MDNFRKKLKYRNMIIYMQQTVQLLHSKGVRVDESKGDIKKVIIDNVEVLYLKFLF